MITEQTIAAIVPHINVLADKNQSLKVVPGSTLSILSGVNVAANTFAAMANNEVTSLPLEQIIVDSKQKDQQDVVVHDREMTEVVELVSKAIDASFNLARNVVIPTTKTVHDLYFKEMEKLTVNLRQMVNIVPNIYHSVWGTPHLMGLVERFENTPKSNTKCTRILPKINGSELQEMIKTGIDQLDMEIGGWYNDQPIDKLTKAYESFYVNGEGTVGDVLNAIHRTPDGLYDRNDILLIYLVANGFEEHMPDGVNVPLNDLRLMLSRIKEQAGRVLALELKRRERDVKQRNIVYTVQRELVGVEDTKRYTVYVNNDVYMKYLEEGGSPEVIYGAVLKGVTPIYRTLVDDKEKLEQYWQRANAMYNQRLAAHRYDTQRSALITAMTKHLNEMPTDELPADRSALQKRTVDCLAKVQPKAFADDLSVTRQLVCDVLYADTNARMVLDAMETAEAENPNMPPRECALLAAIDLYARWIAAQINVSYN